MRRRHETKKLVELTWQSLVSDSKHKKSHVHACSHTSTGFVLRVCLSVCYWLYPAPWQVRLLEADNKTEPDTLDRWKGERDKAERESAKANVAYVTIREIVKSFKDVPEEEEGGGGEGAVEQEQEHQPAPEAAAG